MMSIKSTLQLTNINQVLFTEPVMKRSDSEFAAFKQPEVWIRPDLNYCLKLLPRELGNLILSYTDAYLDWYLEDIQKKYGDKFMDMVLRSIPLNITFKTSKKQLLTIGRFLGTLNERNKINGFDCMPYPFLKISEDIVSVIGEKRIHTKITAGIIVRNVKVYLEKRKVQLDIIRQKAEDKKELNELNRLKFKAECKVGDIITMDNYWGATLLITKVNDKTVSGVCIQGNITNWEMNPDGKWRLTIHITNQEKKTKLCKLENIFGIAELEHQVSVFTVIRKTGWDTPSIIEDVPYIRNSMEKQFKSTMDRIVSNY
jgi:hypothetical protein